VTPGGAGTPPGDGQRALGGRREDRRPMVVLDAVARERRATSFVGLPSPGPFGVTPDRRWQTGAVDDRRKLRNEGHR
jgi:hypothetical protein